MSAAVYFDQHVDDQRRVASGEGNRRWCYQEQVALVEALLRPGMTVLDVGCGPSIPYDTRGVYVIGLDPSAVSLDRNTDVDERLCASATAIPLPDASVDLVVAFYSVHHMTARTVEGCDICAEMATAEMARVVRPGGQVLIFEMRPHGWARRLQDACWDLAKAALGDRLDACFPRGAVGFETRTFAVPRWALIAPVVALPWLRIPRGLYPFDAVLYRWTKEQTDG